MGDLSPHFSREEFQCQCGCKFDTVDVRLLDLLEQIRQHFDRPVKILSGARCDQHNRNIGGAEKSQHKLGRAADISVEGTPPHVVQELAHQLGAGGVGRYSTFTHIDSRNGVSRWGEHRKPEEG